MILAIDPSLNFVGWAVQGGAYGTIRSKGDSVPEKLRSIAAGLSFELARYSGTAVVEIPGRTYDKAMRGGKSVNQAAMFKLCMATGAVILALGNMGFRVETVEAHVWKANFSRRAYAYGKDFFIRCAGQVTKQEVKTDHEADAICLAWWWGKVKG